MADQRLHCGSHGEETSTMQVAMMLGQRPGCEARRIDRPAFRKRRGEGDGKTKAVGSERH
jgi:hypothetical protein